MTRAEWEQQRNRNIRILTGKVEDKAAEIMKNLHAKDELEAQIEIRRKTIDRLLDEHLELEEELDRLRGDSWEEAMADHAFDEAKARRKGEL